MLLLGTASDAELLDPTLRPDDLLFRLFHEDGVRVFDTASLDNACTCSADKVRGILSTFEADEIEQMTVDGMISVTCQFCSAAYDFPADAIRR
jgi:molecular chaperone Hsp33